MSEDIEYPEPDWKTPTDEEIEEDVKYFESVENNVVETEGEDSDG